MKLLILSILLVGGVLAIPTGPSTLTCVSISYAKFEGPACGVIIFQEMSDETITVSTMGDGICGLEASTGPYPYHIHMNQIPSSGDCSAAGDHFDPYNVGDVVCDPNNPGSCQVGDCSGKHGNFEAPTGTCSYTDQYMSLDSGNKGCIGGKSVVIHQSDDTAFACANIIEVSTEEEIPVPDCSNFVPPTSTTCDSTSPATDVESPPSETSTPCDTSPPPPASTPPRRPPPQSAPSISTTPCDSTTPPPQVNQVSPPPSPPTPSPTSTTTPCDSPTPPPPPPPQTTDCDSSTTPPDQDNHASPPTSTSDTTPCDTPTPLPNTPCDTSTTPPEQDNHASPPGPTSTSTPCDTPTPPPPPPTTDCDSSTSPPDQDNHRPPPTPTSDTTPCDTPTPTPTTPCDTPTTPPEEVNQPTPPPDSSDAYSTDCDTSGPTPPPAQFNPFPPLTVTTSDSYTSSDSFAPQETDEGGQDHDFSPPSPTYSCSTAPTDDHEGKDSPTQTTAPSQPGLVTDAPAPTVTSGQYVPGSTGIPTGLVTLITSSVATEGPVATNAPLFTGVGARRAGIAKWSSLIIVGIGLLLIR